MKLPTKAVAGNKRYLLWRAISTKGLGERINGSTSGGCRTFEQATLEMNLGVPSTADSHVDAICITIQIEERRSSPVSGSHPFQKHTDLTGSGAQDLENGGSAAPPAGTSSI